jgi:hypothetical protein
VTRLMCAAVALLALACGNTDPAGPDDDAEGCRIEVDPVPELADAARVAADRWRTSTGCDVRLEPGGIPLVAWNRVFIGEGPEVVYGSDPQLERDEVCGATVQRPSGAVVGIYISMGEQRCSPSDSVVHELGHVMAKPGTHAEEGIGAPGGTPQQTPLISTSTLEWVCAESPCAAFQPEAP